jgi:hypothetical protein
MAVVRVDVLPFERPAHECLHSAARDSTTVCSARSARLHPG